MRKEWKETAVCLAIIAVAALIYWDLLKLPPGHYDPLGGGTMPRIVSVTIIILTLVALAQILVPVFIGGRAAASPSDDGPKERKGLAALLFLFLALYTLSVQLKVPFAISTVVFLFASTMALVGFRPKMIPAALAIAIGAGLTLNYLFAVVFKVDLP